MEVKFIYSLENELNRVEHTLKNRDMYLKNGYRVMLPQGYSLDIDDTAGVKDQVEAEMKSRKIDHARAEIEKGWVENGVQIVDVFKGLGFEMSPVANIILTKYGTGGSYQLPDMVIINVNYSNPLVVFIHELIHLLTQKSVVDKYQLSHLQKEGLVDWLFINDPTLKKIFPEYKAQSRSELPSDDFIKKIGWGMYQ